MSRNPHQCCNIRKVEPLSNFLSQYDAKFGLIKCNPLAAWSFHDVKSYMDKYGVIYNLLHDRGYPSIGCKYCTRAINAGEELRAGRWSGLDKVECGLHK